MVYHSLFSFHLNYGYQLWGHDSTETQRKADNLQSHALENLLFDRKMKQKTKNTSS